MTWSESWVQIPTLPLINWGQLPSWSFARKVMNIPKIILKGNRWKWLKIVVLTICTQKLLEQTFLKMTELWGSHLQRPRGQDLQDALGLMPSTVSLLSLLYVMHFIVSEAHSFLVSTQEIIIHPAAYGQQVFYPFSPDIGMIPFNNMVLTIFKTSLLKFLVLVHNVA